MLDQAPPRSSSAIRNVDRWDLIEKQQLSELFGIYPIILALRSKNQA
jgi:hypothetical protein